MAVQVIGRYPSWVSSCCSRIVLNEAVVKLSLRSEPSVPPSPAVAPATETTPASPPGMLTVTLVFWNQPTAGVKTAVLPCTTQCPETDGDSVGIGEFGASGAEKCTRMGPVPMTPFVPAAGVIETSLQGRRGLQRLGRVRRPLRRHQRGVAPRCRERRDYHPGPEDKRGATRGQGRSSPLRPGNTE